MTAIAPVTLTEDGLRAVAGERSYQRGLDYLPQVEGLRVRGQHITGTVRGSQEYQVLLAVEPGGVIRGECSCRYSREGHFCKHCVAVGLAAIRAIRAVPPVPVQRAKPSAGRQASLAAGSLLSWLDSLSRDDLYVLLTEQLVDDPQWRWRLELKAAADAADLTTLRSRADQLLDPGPPGSADAEIVPAAYARAIRAVAAVLPKLVQTGHAAEAVAIAEHAISQAGVAARYARDDSGLVETAAAQLAARHGAACAAASLDPIALDPIALADFLAARTLSKHEPAIADFARYADLLGQAGLARLRERFTAAWRTAGQGGDGERRALERVLHLTGDAAAMLAICKDHFGAAPDLAGFRQLRAAAEQAGDWPATRRWALGLLREAAGPALIDVLIDVLIDEGDLAAAWDAAATAAAPGVASTPGASRPAVSEAQWCRLADLIAADRPADALAVYYRLAERLRGQAGERAYLRLARFLDSARACHQALGTEMEFSAYLAALREEHKRKRKLIAILDRHQLN